MSKISELSDGGSLLPTDFLIAVRSGGNVKVQADQTEFDRIRLGDNEKIELGNSQDMELYFSGSGGFINNTTGDLTLDVAGDIILDADGGDIRFKDGGTEFYKVAKNGDHVQLFSIIQDGDLTFNGFDGASHIVALTLDMSAAGAATFNAGVTAVSSTISSTHPTLMLKTSGGGDTDQATIQKYNNDLYVYNKESSGNLFLGTNSTTKIALGSAGSLTTSPTAGGHAVFNEGGVDADFRVEVYGQSHMLFVDSGNKAIGINTSSPTSLLDVVEANNVKSHVSARYNISNRKVGLNVNNSNGQGFLASNANQVSASEAATYDIAGKAAKVDFENGIELMTAVNGSAGATISYINNLEIDTTGSVFNEAGVDLDFRVESDGNDHMLFVDGGNDKVVMGSSGIPVLNGSSTRTYDLVLDKGVAIGNSPYTHGYIGTDGTDGNVVITANSYSANLGGTRYVKITGGTTGGGGPNSIAEFNGDTGAVFNEGSQDLDFRVESNTESNAFTVDGETGQVGVGSRSGFRFGYGSLEGKAGSSGSGYPTIGYNIKFTGTAADYGTVVTDTSWRLDIGTNSRMQVHSRSSTAPVASGASFTAGPYVALNGTSWTSTSDARLKENVNTITGAIDKVKAMRPVNYTWIHDGEGASNQVGFIAQEMALVVPEVVDIPEDDEVHLGIQYEKLVPVLTAALQEALTKIKTLEARIAALES